MLQLSTDQKAIVFQIEPSPAVGASGDTLRVMDHERDVWLQYVASHGPESGSTFQLVLQGNPVALDTDTQELVDRLGQTYILVRIIGLGDSPIARRVAGIASITFGSQREKDKATEVAAEALLVYGTFYNGLAKREGRIRVGYTSDGAQHVATLASFGYIPSA